MPNYKTQFTEMSSQMGNIHRRVTPYYYHPTYGPSIYQNMQKMFNCTNNTESSIDKAMSDRFGSHNQDNAKNCGSLQMVNNADLNFINASIMDGLSSLFDASMFDGLLDGFGDIFDGIDLNLPDLNFGLPDFDLSGLEFDLPDFGGVLPDFDGLGIDVGKFSQWMERSSDIMCDSMGLLSGLASAISSLLSALSPLLDAILSALGLLGQALGCGEELFNSVVGIAGQNLDMINMVNPDLGKNLSAINNVFETADNNFNIANMDFSDAQSVLSTAESAYSTAGQAVTLAQNSYNYLDAEYGPLESLSPSNIHYADLVSAKDNLVTAIADYDYADAAYNAAQATYDYASEALKNSEAARQVNALMDTAKTALNEVNNFDGQLGDLKEEAQTLEQEPPEPSIPEPVWV